MSLVDISELAAVIGSDVDQQGLGDAIEIAELAISAMIGGEIAKRTFTNQKVRLRKRDRCLLELPEGPLTALTAVSVGGSALDITTLTSGYWWIYWEEIFPRFTDILLTYSTGWLPTTLPADVRRAVIETAAARMQQTGKSGIIAESIGDYSVQYTAAEAERILPSTTVMLIQKYRRPQL